MKKVVAEEKGKKDIGSEGMRGVADRLVTSVKGGAAKNEDGGKGR